MMLYAVNVINSNINSDHFFKRLSFNSFSLLDQFVKALQDCQVVSPERVDGYGHFLSYHLNHHASNFRGKRDSKRRDSKSYYKIRHKNKDLFFNLTLHRELLSNNYVLEKRYGNYLGAKILPRVATQCHLIGTVMDSDSRNGRAVISTCNGLVSD